MSVSDESTAFMSSPIGDLPVNRDGLRQAVDEIGRLKGRPAPIPLPPSGLKTNEDEARWLEQTILLRTTELLRMVGISATIAPNGLYDLFLLSLNAATKRGAKRG